MTGYAFPPRAAASANAGEARDRGRVAVANCPECDAVVTVGSDAVKGEIVSCPDCGAELEVKETRPLALALAPEAEEDWGE